MVKFSNKAILLPKVIKHMISIDQG
jgi:hypothetical protein